MEHGLFKGCPPPERLPIINRDMKNELIEDEPFETYLADYAHFNSGGVVMILQGGPKKLDYHLRGILNDEDDEKDHFRFGRLIHMAVLEPDKFLGSYIVEPEFIGMTKDGRESKQSKEAQDKKKAWYADLPPGSLVVTQKEQDMIYEMIDCILAHPQASNFFKQGKPEITGRFTHPRTGLRCKIRPDYMTVMPDGSYYFFDLKSTRAASRGLFKRESSRLLYHVKMALYWDGLTEIMGREPQACALVPVQKTVPSKVGVAWLTDELLAIGRRAYNKAFDDLLRSMETGIWPRPHDEGYMMDASPFDDDLVPDLDWGSYVSEAKNIDERGIQQGRESAGVHDL